MHKRTPKNRKRKSCTSRKRTMEGTSCVLVGHITETVRRKSKKRYHEFITHRFLMAIVLIPILQTIYKSRLGVETESIIIWGDATRMDSIDSEYRSSLVPFSFLFWIKKRSVLFSGRNVEVFSCG